MKSNKSKEFFKLSLKNYEIVWKDAISRADTNIWKGLH